jgi:aminopeptidase 2
MGLVQDASVLASAGLAKSSAALTLISKLGNESENLVWDEISAALAKLASAWWEQPESITEAIKAFRRGLFVPLAQRIGYEYDPNEDAEITELRTLAIATSAATDDPASVMCHSCCYDEADNNLLRPN